jgi:hypothetical protein
MDAFVFLLIIGAIIAVLIIQARAKHKRLREAKTEYMTSLARLKSDPTNADLKQQTLALGRAYSNLTRDSKGVTVFDEVALSNDINAACAGATRTAFQLSGQPQSIDTRLAKLAELKRQGLISDDEFRDQRARILREL